MALLLGRDEAAVECRHLVDGNLLLEQAKDVKGLIRLNEVFGLALRHAACALIRI